MITTLFIGYIPIKNKKLKKKKQKKRLALAQGGRARQTAVGQAHPSS